MQHYFVSVCKIHCKISMHSKWDLNDIRRSNVPKYILFKVLNYKRHKIIETFDGETSILKFSSGCLCRFFFEFQQNVGLLYCDTEKLADFYPLEILFYTKVHFLQWFF